VARKGIIDYMSNDMNENAGLINYIMLGRIYDLLILLCDAQGKGEDVLKIMDGDNSGKVTEVVNSAGLESATRKSKFESFIKDIYFDCKPKKQ
jgi:hypothetical protein